MGLPPPPTPHHNKTISGPDADADDICLLCVFISFVRVIVLINTFHKYNNPVPPAVATTYSIRAVRKPHACCCSMFVLVVLCFIIMHF